MLNKKKHEISLKRILRDIYKDKDLQSQLGFKGGTCLYFFYDLNRFSTDLDFNIIGEEFDSKRLDEIIRSHIEVEDFKEKRNTYLWLGKYESGYQKVKVEVSKRDYPDQYLIKDFLGIPVRTMAPEYMFAHKLCAITDRKRIQNRDLFDSWFMFKKDWEPDVEIMTIRTGLTHKLYYMELIEFIHYKAKDSTILDGLGEVLDESTKSWVKDHLIDELITELEMRYFD
jgi:predicted nucleotidyltransferase component of viral defense system